MQFDIQTAGFSLSDSLKDYTTRHMQFAFHRHDAVILQAHVWLADINGLRGGVDKRCQIELKLAGQNNIVIEDVETDLYVAIDRACERCMRTLNRRIARARQISHELLPTIKD